MRKIKTWVLNAFSQSICFCKKQNQIKRKKAKWFFRFAKKAKEKF
jgi:hypothetical protein